MATVSLKGTLINTIGSLPKIGSVAPDFELTKTDLSDVTLNDYKGSKVILNIFHSLDTGTCANSVRKFNEEASKLENTKILCISKDLPFANGRFCESEGIENLEVLSDFRNGNFGKNYNLEYVDGPIRGLLSRCIIVLDENSKVLHTEQVYDVVTEPDYKSALNALK
ncbi:thiol peroxidase [Snuella sedimenti]|uniref:Thiol peroxidase n=1 Tax=Snuella sedimenti TaxID=2798802 RepID=A0A8J7IMK3_9FLAO|nr:thiol peroxidase [Snuella sedimenti]MBJ6367302.1 thiol peroxidase [Snuella sedimenti]